MLSLPDELRSELKSPLGPVYTEADALLAAANLDDPAPLVTVGDVVTYHVLQAGHAPTVALVDERTEREAVDENVRTVLNRAREQTFTHVVEVKNPPATITEPLLDTLVAAIDRPLETTMITIDGEEHLATLAAVLALPDAGAVVYGQPGEGMVLVKSDAETRERAQSLLSRMDGDVDRALALLTG